MFKTSMDIAVAKTVVKTVVETVVKSVVKAIKIHGRDCCEICCEKVL